MASTENGQYQCVGCQKVNDFERYKEIDVTENPELREAVLKNEIFQYVCPQCHTVNFIQYPVLYRDSNRHFMVWLIPGGYDENPMQQFLDLLDEDEKQKIVDEWKIRVVETPNELSEKILIFENQKDDRILEIQKVLMRMQIAQAKPDMKVVKLFYSPTVGKINDNFSIQTEEGFGQAVDVYEDLYQQLVEEVLPKIPNKYFDTFVFDENWAFDTLGYQGKKES